MTEGRDEGFENLLSYIKRNRGFDFTGYKRPSLMRRFGHRMAQLRVETYDDYLEYLDRHPDEFHALFDTILINVTAFFRDAAAWTYVAEEIVPQVITGAGDAGTIRVWSPGCASGEEPYTLAIVFAEALGEQAYRERVKIYATDIDEHALSAGRHAVYDAKQLEPVPLALRERYFERLDGRYAFRADLRRAVIFGRHNLLEDPPISRVNLLVARNTLMYFSPDKQARILENFHFALNEGGFLFLGKSEMMLTRTDLFVPVDLRRRVFAPVGVTPARRLPRPVGPDAGRQSSGIGNAALESAPVAQIVVDAEGTLTVANSHARRLFGLRPTDIGRPFADVELSYRPAELRSKIEQVAGDGQVVHVREVPWVRDDRSLVLDIQLAPVRDGYGDLLGTTVTFLDVSRFTQLQEALESTNHELETAYEELQATSEELETTNEELQSTNEELETTNEELQSTNEELETMNEELQSTNEEMETMNDEFRLRTDDLADANAFLESILGSLGFAVVVVDHELEVQHWNAAATDLWGLREDEVVGAHLLNLDIGLSVDELHAPVRAAIDSGERQTVTLAAINRRGRPFAAHVTSTAMRAPNGDVVGAILQIVAGEEP